MALAYLTAGEAVPGSGELTADIGTSEFYEVRIGARGADDDELARVDHVLPLRRREGGGGDSSFTIRLPPGLVARGSRDVQLCSFRDAQRNGPACSRIVALLPAFSAAGFDAPGGSTAMSALASDAMFRPCRQVAFSFEESAISHEMFFDELLGALRALAPAVIDAAPAIVGAVTADKGRPDSDLVARLLQAVADALKQREGKAEPAKPQSLGPTSHAQFVDGGVISGPLLASLLGPVLQQAPQLLQVLTDKPLQFLTTLMQARQQAQAQKQQSQQNFIQGLLAEANKSMLLQELVRRMGAAAPTEAAQPAPAAPAAAAASLALRAGGLGAKGSVAPRSSARYRLTFETGAAIMVAGKPRSVFRPERGLTLVARLVVQGPPPRTPLPRAIADVELRELDTRRPVLSKSFRLTDVAAGAPIALTFDPAELAAVPRLRDLQVVASIRWPAPSGGSVAAQGTYAIFLSGGRLLGALGPSQGPEIPLDDPATYRSFWNRVWEGPGRLEGEGKRWELDVVCRYYLRAAAGQDSNARIETRLALDAPPDPTAITYGIRGRMKSGLELSLDELNRLAPLVGGDLLEPADLEVMKSGDVATRLELEATTRVQLRGRKSDSGVLWVFPEVTLRELEIATVQETDANGQVTRVETRRVRFPFPSSVHFVSLRSS